MTKEVDQRNYLAEFLAAGGSVQQIPIGHKSDPAVIVHMYGRPKKKAVSETTGNKDTK